MKPIHCAMLLSAALILSPAVNHVARAQTTVTPDPKTTYGWVFLEAGKSASAQVSIPADELRTFDDSSLPRRANGYDLSSVVRLAKIESDSPIDVNLARATLVFRGGENRRIRNDSKPRYNVFLELNFTMRDGANVKTGQQMPVKITLENAQNGNRTTFFVVAQAR